MTKWLDNDVIANEIKIHCYRTGGDKPPIVLCHGATDDGLCWAPVAQALAVDYDVIMPDARWHGCSDGPAGGDNVSVLTDDLVAFVRALKLERPILMGHSMGAHSVFQAIARDSSLARAAILEEPPFREPAAPLDDEQLKKRAGHMRQSMMAYKSMSREALMAMCRQQSPAWGEEELSPWADAKLRVSLNLVDAVNQKSTAVSIWEALPKITCPVLLITADPDKGAIVTPEIAQKAAQAAPSLRVVHIQGAGHNIRRERFEAYMQVVREFLTA